VQIRARYRQLVRKHRRELSPEELLKDEQLRQWANAHLLLLSPERREYDRRLRRTRGRETPPDLLSGLSQGRLLMLQAEVAFVQRKLNEAAEIAKEAIKLDSKNADTYALAGDILREQGRYPNALTMYNYAIQFDPQNRRYWERLEEVTALRAGRALPKRFRREVPTPFRRPIWVWVLIGLALVGVEITMLALYGNWGEPWLFGIPRYLVYAAVGDGFLLGLVLAATAVLGPFDDELVWYQVAGLGSETVPIGIFIALPGVVLFWVAPLFYLIVSLLDEHFSLSVGIALAVCALVASAFVLLAPKDSLTAVRWLGGNFVFFGFLWGWMIGSMRRRVFEH
jgi:tetratricopeptide (TPR) repeat protein